MNVTQDLSILHLILNASAVVQAVMALLAGVSFMSWYYIFMKWYTVKQARAERLAARDDRHLAHRVGALLQHAEQRMATLVVSGAALLVLGDETVGINDSRATLALPDIAAKRKRLAERQPRLSGETMLDDSPPEDENIDAGIGPAG